ncbi:Nucleotide-binding protein YvcJ [Pseudooceanicola algae]|uniref:Nucleotide-binding protein YvcJ n=2 Tax=Pseudooceanicola algae TaxID=1537215 RepID=A0A418SKX2_9RHOB|nr:Nucleotide-binding protein YvcJ [Pseudooceanicola algae]
MPSQTARLVLVTGPSGAGRSTAIRAMEDLGFEAIDNLPLSLLPRLLDGPPLGRSLVLGIDVRNRDFSPLALIEMLDRLQRMQDLPLELLYLDCRADVLSRRYSETRRRHPMAPDETAEIGIAREVDLLEPIRSRADMLVDTSEMTVHDLRREIGGTFAPQEGQGLAVSLHSFSYKRGLPRGLDMVFDVRFLRNPYWSADLRGLTGTDATVQAYIAEDPRFAPFLEKVTDLTLMLLPAYAEEGKSHLSIGFGCTGGQHRSVTLVERLGLALAEAGWQVSIRHLEQERRKASGGAG